jgi:hypothetical protein
VNGALGVGVFVIVGVNVSVAVAVGVEVLVGVKVTVGVGVSVANMLLMGFPGPIRALTRKTSPTATKRIAPMVTSLGPSCRRLRRD